MLSSNSKNVGFSQTFPALFEEIDPLTRLKKNYHKNSSDLFDQPKKISWKLLNMGFMWPQLGNPGVYNYNIKRSYMLDKYL